MAHSRHTMAFRWKTWPTSNYCTRIRGLRQVPNREAGGGESAPIGLLKNALPIFGSTLRFVILTLAIGGILTVILIARI